MEKVSKTDIAWLVVASFWMLSAGYSVYQTNLLAGFYGFVMAINFVVALYSGMKIYKDYKAQPFSF